MVLESIVTRQNQPIPVPTAAAGLLGRAGVREVVAVLYVTFLVPFVPLEDPVFFSSVALSLLFIPLAQKKC